MESKGLHRPCVALDCVMVSVGEKDRQGAVGRVAVVDESGDVLLDKYVNPLRPVTNYWSAVTGITKADLDNGGDLETTKADVLKVLHGKILVGHALEADCRLLDITHPKEDVRDTAIYFGREDGIRDVDDRRTRLLKRMTSPGRPPALRVLKRVYFGSHIHNKSHSPVEDARTAMWLYKRFQSEWERQIETGDFKF